MNQEHEKTKAIAVKFALFVEENCANCGENKFVCRIDKYKKVYTTENLYELFLTVEKNENTKTKGIRTV